ncbi:MAG: hypothetical protein U9N33_10090 [Campylobacterota bacterium]|nr:hypothetical protein [Campylobacterota bacterium]
MMKVFLLIFAVFLFIGCGDKEDDLYLQAPQAGAYAIFDLENSNIPYPNDILFSGSTDSTLNIPYQESDSDADAKIALNTLNGFSNISPIVIGFSGDIDIDSLNEYLHFYELSSGEIHRELKLHVEGEATGDYIITIEKNRIVVQPIKPLKSATTFVIVLTDDIVSTQGYPLTPDLTTQLIISNQSLFDENENPKFYMDLETATTLEHIRVATMPIIDLALAYDSDMSRDDIVMAWSFKTQSLGSFFTNVKDVNKSAILHVEDSGMTTDVIGAYGKADIWLGSLSDLSYYLGPPSKENPTAPIEDYFTDRNGNPNFGYMPRERAKVDIPILMTKPNSSSDAVINGAKEPWPIVIFQHDISGNRTDLLAIADALADVGYAAIAIDLPLHGVETNTTGFMSSNERTFDLDLVDNTTGLSGGDGIIDISGTHYINLESLLTTRDNMRQTASDLLALKNSLHDLKDFNITQEIEKDINYCHEVNSSTVLIGHIRCEDANGTRVHVSDINCSDENSSDINCTLTTTVEVTVNDIDSSRVAFIGYSFGGIASFGFLNHTVLESVTMAMPSGGIAQVLNNSIKFSSILEDKLATFGIYKGTHTYNSFILTMQNIFDDADPINYASNVGTAQKVFAIEVVGNSMEGSDDQVIPNSIPNAPLSGTEPLLKRLRTVNLIESAAVRPNRAARFTEGNHNSFLDSINSIDATVEMQKQTASFISFKGEKITVTDEFILYNP